MNKKVKALVLSVVFIVVLFGGALLYGNLTKKNTPEIDLKENVSKEEVLEETSPEETETTNPEDEREKYKAIDVKIYNTDGDSVMLSEYYGKPLVINFWASWCPPCKKEMPEFNSVYLEMKDDVNFLMINSTDGKRETQKSAEKYLEEQDFSFPVFYDLDLDASTNYQVTSLPTTIFIDKDGYMITGAEGQLSEELLRKGIGMIME